MGLWNNKDKHACYDVSSKSKVDNTWPKCVIERKGVKTRAQREGVVFAGRIQIQMQMDRSGGRKMRKFSCYFCFPNEIRKKGDQPTVRRGVKMLGVIN